MRKTVFKKWLHIRNDALNRLLAILFSYLIVIVAFTVGLVYLIPEIINSLTQLLNKMPEWANAIMDFVNGLSKKYPQINFDYIEKSITSADSTLQATLNKLISHITTAIVSTGVSVVKFIINLLVAVIVSCYLIIDKKMQARGIKRVVFAVFKEERAKKLWSVAKRSIRIFSDFFDGKMIDSLIMGILCFFCMLIISLFGVKGFPECSLLVSIIVCITNMIPYFGPFLGGIPSVLLLCIYSPKSALIFAILIIVLQQFDGNFLGPKILGNSTGLSSFWVLFSILLFGGLFGFVGMLLGVPLFAVIKHILSDIITRSLRQKNLPVQATDYAWLASIDEQGNPVRLPVRAEKNKQKSSEKSEKSDESASDDTGDETQDE